MTNTSVFQPRKRGILRTINLNLQATLATIETVAQATLVAAEVIQKLIEDASIGAIILAAHIRNTTDSYLKEEVKITREDLLKNEDPISFLAKKFGEVQNQEEGSTVILRG